MFNNLIESSSHKKEFKRRGSFLLFTTATYLVIFAIAGVVSIYAYDAHLEQQSTELELLGMVPVEPQPEPAREQPQAPSPRDSGSNTPTESTRTVLIASAADPTRVPDTVGTERSPIPPALTHSRIGPTNTDPQVSFASGRGIPGATGTGLVVDMPDPPPPAAVPTPTPVKVLRISVVLNGQATSLPKPAYPPIARQVRQQGTVAVQVMIDEFGKVVSAKATSGPPLLTSAAEKAAWQATFSPTKIGDQPVKVQGTITYNFVLN